MRTPLAIMGFVVATLLLSWGAVLLPPWLAGWLGPCTYGTARFGGLVLAGLCALPVLMLLRLTARSRLILGVILVLNVLVQMVLGPLTFHLFLRGFTMRVLQVAPVAAWNRLPSEVGATAEPSPSKPLSRDQLPKFVAQMYPAYRQLRASLTGTPQKEGPAVILWWLDTRFSIGVAVGASYSTNSNTLYIKQIGNGVYAIAFQNP